MAFRPEVIALDLGQAFQQAAGKQIRANTNQFFVALQKGFEKDLVGSRRSFEKINREIGFEMQDAVLISYINRVESTKISGPYRIRGTVPGKGRYAGGMLHRALSEPQNVFYGPEFIGFGNTNLLDKEAAHWYRLNYGAGGKAFQRYTGRPVIIRFGRVLSTIRLTDDGPSGDFSMPKGRWRTRGSSPGFYPTGKALVFPTEGIAGRRFFDAGVQTLAALLPNRYLAQVQSLVHQAVEEGKGALAHVDVSRLV